MLSVKSLRPPPLKAFKTACTKAACPGRIPHDLRRTAVRNLERAGVPRSVAMKLTRHKTESVYGRYAIAFEVQAGSPAIILNRGIRKSFRRKVDVVKPLQEVGLIRFRGHLPKGGYDVPTDGRHPHAPAAPAVH
jgi:hypothetical protein